MNTPIKPFSQEFVLRATKKHMLRCIDVSIEKTNARWNEFKENTEKSKEVMTTLMELHNMRSQINTEGTK